VGAAALVAAIAAGVPPVGEGVATEPPHGFTRATPTKATTSSATATAARRPSRPAGASLLGFGGGSIMGRRIERRPRMTSSRGLIGETISVCDYDSRAGMRRICGRLEIGPPKGDVQVPVTTTTSYANTYLAVFKRPVD